MSATSKPRPGGLIPWFAANPVAANLLMLLILFGGAGSLAFMDKEVFPRFQPRQFEITALYPGAGPLEIEESVCIPLEEGIYDLAGIKSLKSQITEGECEINVAVLPDYDKDQVMNAARSRVQAIPRLPKALERIEFKASTAQNDDGVIWVALHGPTNEVSIKGVGERVQADLARIPGVTLALNYYDRPYEIAIEVASERLRQYRLSLHEVTEAVRRASVDQSGGLLKSPAGELLLRVKGKARSGAAIGDLVLRANPDGSRVLLRDVAEIKDGLEERLSEWHHNGEPAQGWEIHAEHDTVAVARRVKSYVRDMQAQLPEGLRLSTWWDDSQAYEERTWTLIEDGLSGFVLVCTVLTLFLRLRVALWAGVGILTSVFGALWLMPALDVSLNMLSLFGFLLAMGILVDDAIIIGESVYTRQEKLAGDAARGIVASEAAEAHLDATIGGVLDVALPVFLAVMVALVAFLPGLFLPGWAGKMMRPICLVMILSLVFSLVEALLILPAHLAPPSPRRKSPSCLARIRYRLNGGLDDFVRKVYGPALERALSWRYLVIAGFAVLLLLSGALVAGRHVRLSLQADVTKDSFWVNIKLPEDTPHSLTRQTAARVERALLDLRNEMDGKSRAGGAPVADGFDPARATAPERSPQNGEAGDGQSVIVGLETLVWEHGGGFWTELSTEARKNIAVEDFIQAWRRRIGDIAPAKIDFLYKEGDVPYDIEFNLGAPDPALLPPAAERLKARLSGYPGVYDVVDTSEPGKPEIRLKLRPEAERLGVRLEDLAEQMRHGYFGDEVQRLQRGRSEVKVMVRLPRAERQSLDDLRSMSVRLPGGAEVPLGSLADIELTPGYAKLVRQDRQRVLKVQARVDPKLSDVNAVYSDLESGEIPALKQGFPGLDVGTGEERREQEETVESLGLYTVIALVVIYALIAVPFRSYTKPLIFLLAAPVAWSGAVLAHWLAGLPLSMESLVGMIAASGVVVNDSLVLLDYIKEHGDAEKPVAQLIAEACTARFRPILLAFLTNFAGFLPTLLETSEQAQFLIPMTLSLSAGLLVGMAASLILTPACYASLELKARTAGPELERAAK